MTRLVLILMVLVSAPAMAGMYYGEMPFERSTPVKEESKYTVFAPHVYVYHEPMEQDFRNVHEAPQPKHTLRISEIECRDSKGNLRFQGHMAHKDGGIQNAVTKSNLKFKKVSGFVVGYDKDHWYLVKEASYRCPQFMIETYQGYANFY